jgi:streptogramin lyase
MRYIRLLTVLALSLAVPAVSAEASCVSRFTNGISQGTFLLGGITTGPDRNMWFGESNPRGVNRIARITPTGVVTVFSTGISPSADIGDIAAGADGNLWFTETGGNRIGRVTPGGVVTEFSSGITGDAGPTKITAGPDGNIWFTELFANQIGRITPSGRVAEFPTGHDGAPSNTPWSITKGPDGNVWFVDAYGIGRISPAGVLTRFDQIGYDELVRQITSGPDGNLWVSEFNKSRIDRITPSGQLTEFTQGISHPEGITAGPDGNVWFIDSNRVEQITPSGQVTNFSQGIAPAFPIGSIAAGPAGTLWFPEGSTNAIGRILPHGSCPPVRVASRRAKASKKGKLTLRLSCGSGEVGCTGTLTLIARTGRRSRAITIASVEYSVPARQTSPIDLTLTTKGLKLLQRALKHRLPVTARARRAHRKITLLL